MRKFLIALLMSLLVASTANAEIETYTGTDDYTIGEHETQEEAENHSKTRALRNAQEQSGFFIGTYSQAKNFKLVKDEIVVIAQSVMKVVGAPQYRKEILSDGKSILIHTTIKVQIDTNDLDRRLAEIGRQQNPAPPVEQPANPPAPPPMDDESVELLNFINARRATVGVKPLKINETLMETSARRAREITKKFSSIRPDGKEWLTELPTSYQNRSPREGF